MIILYIILGLILLGIAVFLLRVIGAIIAGAIGCALLTGMICGVFYLLGWMESGTIGTCMQWAFVVGIPIGIYWVIADPDSALSDEPSSSSSSRKETYTDGNGLTISNHTEGSDYFYDEKNGDTYLRDMWGNFHKR